MTAGTGAATTAGAATGATTAGAATAGTGALTAKIAAPAAAAATQSHLPHWFYAMMYLLMLLVVLIAAYYTRRQFSENQALVKHFRDDPQAVLAGANSQHAPSTNGATPASAAQKPPSSKTTA